MQASMKAGVILVLHSAIQSATALPHPAPWVFLGTQQARARQAALSTAARVDNLATAQNCSRTKEILNLDLLHKYKLNMLTLSIVFILDDILVTLLTTRVELASRLVAIFLNQVRPLSCNPALCLKLRENLWAIINTSLI